MNVIVTWMYSSPKDKGIFYPQARGSSEKQKIQNYYWCCVFLLFESSNRLNKDARHILFVNKLPPKEIDGIDTELLVKQYGIEIVEFESVTISPSDYFGLWNTQFIVLDVLDWLKHNTRPSDAVFILDSDIVFNRPIGPMLLEAIAQRGSLLYTMSYTPDENINGLTRRELLQVAKEIDSEFPENDFLYSGGEIVCCTGSELGKIAELARQTYMVCLERHRLGLKKFNEEAHLLSFVYQCIGYEAFTANPFIKRIWTDRSLYSNIEGTENELTLWHLPAEKKKGFTRVFRSYRLTDGRYELPAKDFEVVYRLKESPANKVVRIFDQAARRTRNWLRGKSV